MSEPKENSGYRFTGEVKEQLRQEMVRLKLRSVQQLLDRIVSAHLEKPATRRDEKQPSSEVRLERGYPYRPENREWHDKLETILEDPKERGGIEANLRWGANEVASKSPSPHSKRKLG